MFLYRESPDASPILIPQVSHSWMAWQMADHWGNREFKRPAPRAEVLAAVLLHDSGWTEFDRSPGINSEGHPVTFDRMPPVEHLDIWRACIDRTASHSRYAALLVATHFAYLAGVKTADMLEKGETESARRAQSFEATARRQLRVWREGLAADPRYDDALEGPGWATNAAILSACDRIAVHLCAGFPRPFDAKAMTAQGEERVFKFSDSGERHLKVRPWPFQGNRVRLQCEGRRMTGTTFTSNEALAAALDHAPVERLTFTLERCSASG
ncbi:MAG: DUF3891 family protein [bacterium]|nr:DUF3891 family protein [bacterium]